MKLTETQKAFATSRSAFPAFCGGFGSGKSAAAIARALALKFHFKKCDIAYYLPTHPLIEDIAYKRFTDICERKNWEYKLNKSSCVMEFPGAGRIIFRTMTNPERIIGYEVAHSVLDELDTLKPEKARLVWNRVIARNRQKMPNNFPNTVAVATTPEGFGFVWEQWEKKAAPGYVLFRASTIENEANLQPGYIDNLRNTYPSNLLAAYLDGEFVNLTSGSVYPQYNRELNRSAETVKGDDILHIGMDFNVSHMAASIFVLRGGDPHAVDEFTGIFDTPAMIATIKRKYPNHRIFVYPDASGNSRSSSNASVSDISLLQQAKFSVLFNPANPEVRDRVLSMNAMINIEERRRLRINPDTCPGLVEGLEKQAYNKYGDPDKESGFDHIVDSCGYFIAYKFPVARRIATVNELNI
mgnify:CR=1 FL=1